MQLKSLLVASLAGSAMGQMSLQQALASNPNLSNLTAVLAGYQPLVQALSGMTNITLLAPTNLAFSRLLNSSMASALTMASNASIQALLSYHVLNGSYPNITSLMFPHTMLMDPMYSNVTGGQVVAAVPGNPTHFVSGLLMPSNVSGNATAFTGGTIYAIDSFLVPPPNISTTAVAANLSSIVGALGATNLTNTVNGLRDVTVFVPNNAAFQAIGSALPNLTTQQITSILQYHVVQGVVGYSTMLKNMTLPTVGGTNVTIQILNGTVFVNQARVVLPNVLVANGVVHVIDSVLNPANATAKPDPSATTGVPGFSGASSASNAPYTSGVPVASGSNVASSSAPGASATKTGAAVAMRTGAVGAAVLFGGAAVALNL